MNRPLNWGIMATGNIARRFATDLPYAEQGTLLAVGSRTLDSAQRFAAEFDAPRAYGSYDELVADPDVDAIYISLPNHLHAYWAIRCAEAGKHILCEKPLATNHPEAMTVIEAARYHDVFLMEAFMYRCHPQTAKLAELVASGAIGDVRVIQASFSYDMGGYNENIRQVNEYAGGGIMDVGCYPVSLARLIAGAALGQPFAEPVLVTDGYQRKQSVKAFGHVGDQSRVDEWTSAVVQFPGDIVAELTCGIRARVESVARIWGANGHIVTMNPWLPDDERTGGEAGLQILLYRTGQSEPEEIVLPAGKPLYAVEADAVAAHVADREAPAMSWQDSLGNMMALDSWREELGLVFDNEKYDALKTPVSGRPVARRSDHNMQYGQVAGIDKPVSRLVMGTMIFKRNRLPLACSMLDYFFEIGGNCLDTAHVYGSEETVGEWLKLRGIREEMVVIGKGARDDKGTPEGITAQLLETLEKMQLDYLDMYMMHTDNPSVPAGELVACLNEHLDAGRIRAFGGSNWSIERIQEADAYAEANGLVSFAASSPNLSLAVWNEPMWPGCLSASDAISRAWYTERRLPVFAWSSQATGFFTGRYSPEDRDVSWLAPIVRTWFNDQNFARLQRARELAAQKGVTAAQVALAYVLQQPFPTFALIGPQSINELRDVLPALDIHLTPEETAWLNLED